MADPGDGAPTLAASASASPIVAAGTVSTAEVATETTMRSAFMSWKNADTGVPLSGITPAIAVPSALPLQTMRFSSTFGIRSDPFEGTARMHAGVDLPGPVGTPVYATADGVVDRAERAGGYGNLVELDHGKGLQTRYGHLSKILVTAGAHVHRGDLIALMGSTGRSTGPHLHYEVRIDGRAVNPVPFLTTADYWTADKSATTTAIPAAMDSVAP